MSVYATARGILRQGQAASVHSADVRAVNSFRGGTLALVADVQAFVWAGQLRPGDHAPPSGGQAGAAHNRCVVQPAPPSLGQTVEEARHGQDLDSVFLHPTHEIFIALDIVIAGDEIGGPANEGRLQERVVVWITADVNQASGRHGERSCP